MEKLNIGFVRRGFSPSGGAEAYLRRLARGVSSAGHAATLFTTADWPDAQWPAGRIHRIAATEPEKFADSLDRLQPKNHCDAVVSLERVWQCDIFRAGDGVHRAWLERRTRHESGLQRLARRWKSKNESVLRLEKALLAEGGARRVIVNSEMVRNEIVETYGYDAKGITVIRNGVRVSDFGPAPMRRASERNRLGLADADIAVLFIGSGWLRKGLRFAVAAVEKLGDARVKLLVAGRGSPRKYSSRFARFLGEIDDVRALLSAGDIFLLPTIYDPFSNACLEAMAAGIPVITTRANGFSEILEDKVHGSVVDRPDNVEALAEALRFWSDRSRRSEAQEIIMERATRFDISQNVVQTLSLIFQAALTAESTAGKMRIT